jgi:hypothetical protein
LGAPFDSLRFVAAPKGDHMQFLRFKRKLIVKILAAGGIVFAISAVAPAPAWAACWAKFNCGIGESSKCYFAVVDGNKNRKLFTVGAGESKPIYGLHPGSVFCSSNRPLNMDRCVGSLKVVKLSCD